MQRSTTQRDKDRATIKRGRPDCALCGLAIDYSLPYLDPGAYVVDHIIPFGQSPTPERIAQLDVIENKQAAHRSCNRTKSDKVADNLGPFVTSRTW